ncbi:MAG: hypothetical protein AAB663_02180 [Patescibacteria group bacterium]
MLTLLALYGSDRWYVTIATEMELPVLCGRKNAIIVFSSRDHQELEQKGGALLMHITRTAIAEPTLFGRELVLAAVDSFMRLPAAPHRITPALY